MPAPRPVVTLTSDFGVRDAYVAEMKASVLRHCAAATLIDVTHELSRHDVIGGSITLERALASFERNAVHLVVVDPGVGTSRRILVARLCEQFVVCPDNGLITWAWRVHGGGMAFQLKWRPERSSATFHGRDIMGPVAGMLAAGQAVHSIAEPIDDPVLLDIAPATDGNGSIIHVDHFGNLTTNIPQCVAVNVARPMITVGSVSVGELRATYGDVEPGKALALIGSSGLIEIAVRGGSAAEVLGLSVGDRVVIS